MKVFKIVLIITLTGLIAIQFIRPEKNTAPVQGQDISLVMNVPSSVHNSLRDACYDCHSNNTNYPLYYNIQPAGLMIDRHIIMGMEELNFSNFKNNPHKLTEIAEVIRENEMPLKSYRMLHRKSRLDDTRKKELIEWAESESMRP